MKIVHVYRTYHPDQASGIAEAIRQTCLATAPHGAENFIFTLSPQPHPSPDRRPEAVVTRARSWAAPASCDLGGPAALAAFAKTVRHADIVHYHFPWPFGDLLHFSARPRATAVMTWHSDVVRQGALHRIYQPLMDAMLRRMRLIAATSAAYARTSPTLSRPDVRNRVRVLPLGIGDDSTAAPDTTALARLGISRPFALFLGAMRYYKGLDVLLASAARGFPLVLAGGGPDLPRLRHACQGGRNIIFTGTVTEAEKTALLQACRCLVLPSNLRSEAYGMVLVEAAMGAKPMVSCEIGTGTSFVNLDGVTGFVVPPDHPTALAEAIGRLMDDEALAGRLGTAARQRYEQLFSGPVFGRACMDFYREASAAPPQLSSGPAGDFRDNLRPG